MHSEPIHIETERLQIREILVADEQGMWELDQDGEVHKYLGNHPFKQIEQTRDLIANIRRQYIENGIGRWAIIKKDSAEFVGWTGFKLMKERINNHINYYDFGYRLVRRFWGKGYATESAIAALKYGIENLQLKNIYGMTDPENLASRNVLEKIGMMYVGLFPYDGETNIWRLAGAPTTWYQMPDKK
jgi:[ribosomal protein S5]-alanine N-acetyltransferase